MGEPTPAPPKPEPPKLSPKPRVQPEQFEIRLTKRLIALEDKIDALQGGSNHESALVTVGILVAVALVIWLIVWLVRFVRNNVRIVSPSPEVRE